jgi:hypothetical protein
MNAIMITHRVGLAGPAGRLLVGWEDENRQTATHSADTRRRRSLGRTGSSDISWRRHSRRGGARTHRRLPLQPNLQKGALNSMSAP